MIELPRLYINPRYVTRIERTSRSVRIWTSGDETNPADFEFATAEDCSNLVRKAIEQVDLVNGLATTGVHHDR